MNIHNARRIGLEELGYSQAEIEKSSRDGVLPDGVFEIGVETSTAIKRILYRNCELESLKGKNIMDVLNLNAVVR